MRREYLEEERQHKENTLENSQDERTRDKNTQTSKTGAPH